MTRPTADDLEIQVLDEALADARFRRAEGMVDRIAEDAAVDGRDAMLRADRRIREHLRGRKAHQPPPDAPRPRRRLARIDSDDSPQWVSWGLIAVLGVIALVLLLGGWIG